MNDYIEDIKKNLGEDAAKEFVLQMNVKGLPEKIKSKEIKELQEYIASHPLPPVRIHLNVAAFKNKAEGDFNLLKWEEQLKESDVAALKEATKDMTEESGINAILDSHKRIREINIELEKVIGTTRTKELFKAAGYDGFVDSQGREKGNFLIFFDPNQLAIDEIGYFKLTSEPEKKLVALHNIDPTSLTQALNNGGMIAPSIAITNVNNPYTDFGGITLIADKNLIDPASGEVKVFAGDVYSPTLPRPEYEVNKKPYEKWVIQTMRKTYDNYRVVASNVQNIIDDFGSFGKDLKRSSHDQIVKNNKEDMKLVYLIDKGVKIEWPMKDKEVFYDNMQIQLNGLLS